MTLRVFEAFAGYGSQSIALGLLAEAFPDFRFQTVGISEIDKYAIKAYAALHGSTIHAPPAYGPAPTPLKRSVLSSCSWRM